MQEPGEQIETGFASIVLDDAGVVLHAHGSGANARYAEAVAEGEGLEQHIHPDDRDFFDLTRNWTSAAPAARRW